MKTLLVAIVFLFVLSSHANILGADIQNFNPSISGEFVTVESPFSLSQGDWNLALFLDYSSKVLPYYQSVPVPGGNSVIEPENSMLYTHLLLGYGITDRWDGVIALGVLADRSSDSSTFLTSHAKTGVATVRLETKYLYYLGEKATSSIHFNFDFLKDRDNPYTGVGGGHNYSLLLSYQYLLTHRWNLAFNGGYRARSKGSLVDRSGVAPFAGQILYSAAIKYILSSADLILELYGSSPTDDVTSPTDRDISNLEALLGVNFDITDDFSISTGLTREVIHGLATPEFRIYAGVRWYPGSPKEAASTEPSLPMELPEEPLREFPQLYFWAGTAQLLPQSQSQMEPVYKIIRAAGAEAQIMVEGHSDSSGPEISNFLLSVRRAKEIAKNIGDNTKLKPSQIKVKGFGEKNPIDSSGRSSRNRRVILKLIKNSSEEN